MMEMTQGTVEESMIAIQERKKALGDTVLDGDDKVGGSGGGGGSQDAREGAQEEDDVEEVYETKLDSSHMSMVIQHALGLARAQPAKGMDF